MSQTYKIGPGSSARQYAPVGRCIYCHATEYAAGKSRLLSEEHIVAEGLGGTLILPEASCERCAKATTRIEGAVLRTILWTPRAHLGIRGKRRKRPALFPLSAVVDGREVRVELPIEQYPTALFLPGFVGLPDILTEVGAHETRREYVSLIVLNFQESPVFRAGVQFHSPTLDRARFAQFLAKMAHAFAVAELGFDVLLPLLTPLILEAPQVRDEMKLLIGGLPDEPPSDALHEIGWEVVRASGKAYVTVTLRLFANFDTPRYSIVAGEWR